MKYAIAAVAVMLAGSAFAQTAAPAARGPNETVPTVVNPGSPAAVNSGPGATTSVRTEATGAGTVSNNPAGAGNASQPAKANSTPGSSK